MRRPPLASWGPLAAALAAGALLTFAFAPFNIWPLAILCPALQMFLWQGTTPRRAAALGFSFGVGTFGAGTWWLYISIHIFGLAPVWLTLLLVMLLVAVMASYQALLGWLVARLAPVAGGWRCYAALPALWLLMEWWRGWFLSGFPWLSLGYSQTDTWLRGYAPVVGVYGLTLLLLLQSGALLALLRGGARARLGAVALLVIVWAGGRGLDSVSWTHAQGTLLPVAIVQGAIPQDEKWQLDNRDRTMERYAALNQRAYGARLIVWPESAIPEMANEIANFLAATQANSRAHDADVIMGVVRAADNGKDYYNSILALTGDVAFYDKRHLVPYAEYFPVPAFVRKWLRLLSLPYSDFTAGAARQAPLRAGAALLAPTICYEDNFGNAQRALVARSNLMVNVTNDAWFGRSPARYQHLQISRLRALEAGRYLLRAANDGVSAIIGPRGELAGVAAEYQPDVLRGTVELRDGLSPYTRLGDGPVLLLALAGAAAAAWRRRRLRPRHGPG